MNPPDASTKANTGSAVLRFARCWADFTKALSIYPATNMRVRTTLETMLEAHGRALKAPDARPSKERRGVAVVFRDALLELNGVEHEVEAGDNLLWLRERLDRAALAGVEFTADLSEEPLVEFSKHLLRAYLEGVTHRSYETLWPMPFAGMLLIDRRFEGGFGEGGSGKRSSSGGSAGAGARAERSGRRGGGELAGEDLVDVLLEDGDVMARITRIRTLADDKVEPGVRGSASDLLDRIVRNMPAEALKDRETFLTAAYQVLEALEDDAASGRVGSRSSINDDGTLKALLHSVGHSHFARSGPDRKAWARNPSIDEKSTGRNGKSRAGDDEITDDIDALLGDLRGLPEAPDLVLARADMELSAEEIAVCMHYLTNMDEKSQPPGLRKTLKRLLASPGKAELAALRACVLADAEKRASEGEAAGLTPIQSFLRSTNRAALLKACDLFAPEWLAEVFPRYFVPYLESIDPSVPAEIAALDALCRTLGPDRLSDAARSTHLEARLVDADVMGRLLCKPTRDRMGFARLCLTWYGQAIAPRVAAFLRGLDPAAPEAFLLYQFSDLSDLTVDYLFAMIDLALGRADSRKVRDAVAGALCRHIRRLGNYDPANAARVESIRSLARFPSPAAQQMLRELTRGTWRPFSDREPTVIRRVAQSVSKACKAA